MYRMIIPFAWGIIYLFPLVPAASKRQACPTAAPSPTVCICIRSQCQKWQGNKQKLWILRHRPITNSMTATISVYITQNSLYIKSNFIYIQLISENYTLWLTKFESKQLYITIHVLLTLSYTETEIHIL